MSDPSEMVDLASLSEAELRSVLRAVIVKHAEAVREAKRLYASREAITARLTAAIEARIWAEHPRWQQSSPAAQRRVRKLVEAEANADNFFQSAWIIDSAKG